MKKHILIVDDEQSVVNALSRVIRQLNVEISTANGGEEGLRRLSEVPIDLVLSDLRMPGMSGNEFLQQVSQLYPETIRIMLTASTDLDGVVEAINHGHVWGYLQKPWDNKSLLITLEQAINYQTILSERAQLQKKVQRYEKVEKQQLEGFVGSSVPMQFVYKRIQQAAPSQASVWLTGPSGAGKEVAAQAIHNLSKRADKPFIAINCAAIPQELMESEIFGHIKGAFTGASASRDGAASLADGGTLFLDEIGEMDIGLQAKLLRFIQLGEFKPVGAGKVQNADIRFVCATNRDALQAIRDGKLREDLYYRLNVIPIDIPPLSERGEDIVTLAKHFLETTCKSEDKALSGFTLAAEKALLSYPWPGNVRQLQNVVHNAVVMCTGSRIDVEDLNLAPVPRSESEVATTLSIASLAEGSQPMPPLPSAQTPLPAVQTSPFDTAAEASETEHQITPLAELERQAIEQAISRCNDNIVQAASALGVSPSTLYRKLQSWGKLAPDS